MFTIKINWHSPDFPSYSVYAATKYTVNNLANGSKQLYISNGDNEPAEVLIDDRCRVFVMNAKGSTIDVI